jgi:2-polyprenyl-3-methyl-5-hydroxy-6-metoxy-1,4-benzoquinol methylase
MAEVREIKIASPETIAIYKGDGSDLKKPEDVTALYHDFSYLNWIGYLKTLMYTSIFRRGKLIPFLNSVKGKRCLDHGCGVASHSIILAELGNDVSILDIEGPALSFARSRIKNRGHKITSIYTQDEVLLEDKFDVIISVEVLEHVPDPMTILNDLLRSLKRGGLLYLRYSTMIKNSSGHFKTSIVDIKTYVPDFLKENFETVSPGVYKKI